MFFKRKVSRGKARNDWRRIILFKKKQLTWLLLLNFLLVGEKRCNIFSPALGWFLGYSSAISLIWRDKDLSLPYTTATFMPFCLAASKIGIKCPSPLPMQRYCIL